MSQHSAEVALAGRRASPDVLLERALECVRSGRLAEAEAICRRILADEPRHFGTLHLSGVLNIRRGRFEEAVHQIDRALAIDPGVSEAHNNRGNALKELKRYDEAVASYDRAIALNPVFAEAYHNRANALIELKRLDEALASYDRALALRPYPAVLCGRGIVLSRLRRPQQALADYERAIALEPGYAEAFNLRANVLIELDRLGEALADYDRAIAINPARAEAFYDRAHGRLLAGRYPEGWADHEWRWQAKGFPSKRPKISAPPWQGQDLNGRRLLVFQEQGFGDIIQFARYLPLLRECGAKVAFFIAPGLARLLRPVTAGIDIIHNLAHAGALDFQCALMSLPRWFKTDIGSIPAGIPYLRAERELVARWKERIGVHGFKIGIGWQGNPKGLDANKHIALSEFIALARMPEVRLISLQHKDGLEQLADLPSDFRIETPGEDFNRGPDAFIDTAAVMANLDLIVSCDTSIPHLAGALGMPAWIILKHVADWRWLLGRDDSPWYPTVRLFRQAAMGDWRSAVAKVEQELKSLLALPPHARAIVLHPPRRRPAPTIEVAWGELLDRITMLEIKLEGSEPQRAHLRGELAALCAAAGDIEREYPGIAALKQQLRGVNEALWDLEGALRVKVSDQHLIDLARSVAARREERARLRRAIDHLLVPELSKVRHPSSPHHSRDSHAHIG
jgi:tetratricopeptide (TPR) repeat protein